MVLFYGIPRQDISLPMGWKGSVLDWGPDFNVSGFAWYYALLRVKAELIWYLCYLLSWEICAGKGWLLSPLAFASYWFCYFWTAELHTGSGSLWKWLHAHSETGCILATLRMIFQEVSSFLEAYWLRYFHLRETSRDNFVQNSRRKKKVIRVFWKKCFILQKLCSTPDNSWAWSLITPVRGCTSDSSNVKELAVPPWADQHPGEAAAPP